MQDRTSLYPGRVTLTPVSGQANTYDMVRADQPTQEGTPLSKANLLKDATAALFGLGSGAVPDEVLAELGKYNEYWWAKLNRIESTVYEPYSASAIAEDGINSSYFYIYRYGTLKYADSVTFNYDTGEYILNDPITVSFNDISVSTLNGKYVQSIGNTIATSREGTAIDKILYLKSPSYQNISSDWYYYKDTGAMVCTYYSWPKVTTEMLGYVKSTDRNAYPDNGEQDGYTYHYVGVPFSNSKNPTRIAYGSYIGTGTVGEDAPTRVQCDFEPKAIIIFLSNIQYNTAPSNYTYSPYIIATRDCTRLYVYTTFGGSSVDITPLYFVFDIDNVFWYISKKTLNGSYTHDPLGQANISGKTYPYIILG